MSTYWIRSLALSAGLALALSAGVGAAGAGDLSDPLQGQLQFQLDGLRRQSVTDPAGAARGAAAARRELIQRRGGVALGPSDLMIDRQLRGVQAGGRSATSPIVPSPSPPGSSLPSSVDHGGAPLPSLGDPLRVVSLLLDRADEGLAAGRTAQAQSDLSMAGRELAPLREGPLDGATKAEADALAGRLETLSGRLTAAP